MISNSRRLLALAVAGCVAAAPLAGCGAGREPQTAMPTQLTEGVNVSVPRDAAKAQVDIRNLFVLGPATGGRVAAGGAVPLYGTLINQVSGRPDRLVSVSSPSFQQARLSGGGIDLPAPVPDGGQAVRLVGQPGQEPPVVLQGLTQPLLGGENLRLTLQFAQAGSVTIAVPVVAQQGDYATYAAVPTPTPSATPTQSGRRQTGGPVTSTPTEGTAEPTPTPTVSSASPS